MSCKHTHTHLLYYDKTVIELMGTEEMIVLSVSVIAGS